MNLRIVIVLQQLLQNVLGDLQQFINVLEQRPVIVGRYQVFALFGGRHKPFNSKVYCTNKMLFSIYQLDQVSSPQTVWRLLCR